jgi:hypothetical protein
MESEGPAVGVGDFIVAKKDSVEEALFRSSSDSCLTLREVMMMSPFMSGLEDGVDDGGEETGRGGEPLTGAWSCATTTTAGGAGVMGEKPVRLVFSSKENAPRTRDLFLFFLRLKLSETRNNGRECPDTSCLFLLPGVD